MRCDVDRDFSVLTVASQRTALSSTQIFSERIGVAGRALLRFRPLPLARPLDLVGLSQVSMIRKKRRSPTAPAMTICVEQQSVEDLCGEFGTPLYIYSAAEIRNAYQELSRGLQRPGSSVP